MGLGYEDFGWMIRGLWEGEELLFMFEYLGYLKFIGKEEKV